MANIEGLTALPRLLALLATRTGTLLNLADVSRASGLPYTTLTRYMTLLEATFLVHLLPSWSSNLGSRLVKSPKLLLCDTGLAASLLGADAERLTADGTLLGPLLETFVAMEARKAAGGSGRGVQLFHYRTQTGQEVDLVLEDAAGRLVEVKASATGTSGACGVWARPSATAWRAASCYTPAARSSPSANASTRCRSACFGGEQGLSPSQPCRPGTRTPGNAETNRTEMFDILKPGYIVGVCLANCSYWAGPPAASF